MSQAAESVKSQSQDNSELCHDFFQNAPIRETVKPYGPQRGRQRGSPIFELLLQSQNVCSCVQGGLSLDGAKIVIVQQLKDVS